MCGQQNQEKIWRHFQGQGKASFVASHPRLRYLARRVHKLLGHKGGRVLNIGVGDGFFEEQAVAVGIQVVSLDPDSEAITRQIEKGISGVVGFVEALPFGDGEFDVVAASEVFEHLTDLQREKALAEIARVLQPSGLFIGTVPYNEDLALGETVCPCCGAIFHRWGHQASFTLESLRNELGVDFIPVEIRRTAFVSYSDRGIVGKLKSAIRVMLAKFGQAVSSPNILFLAKRA